MGEDQGGSVVVHLALLVTGAGIELVLVEVLALLGVLAMIGVYRLGRHHDVVDGGLFGCVVTHTVTVTNDPVRPCRVAEP